MELRVQPYSPPQTIKWNYEEVKAALLEKAAEYEAIVYTDDQVKAAKADRASLNRFKKALNDERLRLEREYMQPFAAFKAQVNEIIGIIDRPVQAIDRQVKAFEERQKAEKREAIYLYWEGVGAPSWLQKINPSWLNASYTMKTIQAEIDAAIEQAKKDLEIIRALPAYAFEAEEHYKDTLSLAEAVRTANNLQEMAQRKAAHEAEQAKRLQLSDEMKEIPIATQAEPEVLPTEPQREWIAFQALLTPDEAKALGNYMKTHGIQYKAV